MSKKGDRQALILHEANMHNRVLVTDLANILNVSVDTVRRDIQDLHGERKLVKVHGGAVSNAYKVSEPSQTDSIYAFESKAIIAKKAVNLVKENSVILMSGGTTNLELAKRFPSDLNATVFTPSIPVATALLAHPKIEMILIGGRVSKPSQISIGGNALNTLADISVDICFMGTGYLDASKGLTEFDWEVVQMKKAMIKASQSLVSLTISEKLNSEQRYKICETRSLDTLITELDPSHTALDEYKKQNINII